MPQSATSKRSRRVPSGPSVTERKTVISPSSENLTAFPTRLMRIWRRRTGSPWIWSGTPLAGWRMRLRFLASAMLTSKCSTLSIRSARSKSVLSISSLPASSFDWSRISFKIVNRTPPDSLMVCTLCRCSGDSDSINNRSAMPRIPAIGVRISWLIVARKVDFAAFAASASRYAVSAVMARRRWRNSSP